MDEAREIMEAAFERLNQLLFPEGIEFCPYSGKIRTRRINPKFTIMAKKGDKNKGVDGEDAIDSLSVPVVGLPSFTAFTQDKLLAHLRDSAKKPTLSCELFC